MNPAGAAAPGGRAPQRIAPNPARAAGPGGRAPQEAHPLGRRRGPAGGGRAQSAGAALLLVASLLLVGCGALHSGVTAEANECALALPVAEQAVGHTGHLVLIRPMGLGEAARVAASPLLSGTEKAGAPGRHASLCVAVFRGPYAAGAVQDVSIGGQYAIVVVDVRNQQLAATYVTQQLPPSLCLRHQRCVR